MISVKSVTVGCAGGSFCGCELLIDKSSLLASSEIRFSDYFEAKGEQEN